MADYTERISSLDEDYVSGDLSVFPEELDDKETLYEAANNCKTQLKQTLPYAGTVVIVEDASSFPEKGIIRVGPTEGPGAYEMIYYHVKVGNAFTALQRGFAGSKQNVWDAKKNYVTNAVVAEHHNAIKDAILNMEANLGVKDNPVPESLNGILKSQEERFLAPRPVFRASVIQGPPPLKVRFQNFSTGHIVRYFWDFGDGSTSLEKSPSHTYANEGYYTVKLSVITSTGAQGIATKREYIKVDNSESLPFFYVDNITNPYSVQSAASRTAGTFPPENTPTPTEPKEFWFVDQSDGDITERHWMFGDEETYTETDPNVHDITHIYQLPGDYVVTLFVIMADGTLKRVELPETLTVL